MAGLFGSSIPFDVLRGNRELLTYFNEALSDNKLLHAYIIEGPAGSGKHTLAYAVASAMADGEARARIDARQSPDVTEYGLTGNTRSIGIDTVRALKESAYIMPSELDFRMFIISDAHLLTPQAQNGLLKLLEEPPRSVFFMILCENSANLLTTVRSRAPTMHMQLFSEEELDELLCADSKIAALKNKSPQTYAAALRSSGGSYGAAVSALSSRSKKTGTTALDTVRELMALLNSMPSQAVLFASKLPSKRDELYDFMSDWCIAVRDLIAAKRTGNASPLFYADAEMLETDAEKFTVRELMRFYDVTAKYMQLLDSNVNVASAQLSWLCGMARQS